MQVNVSLFPRDVVHRLQASEKFISQKTEVIFDRCHFPQVGFAEIGSTPIYFGEISIFYSGLRKG
jgi:hypothetical protein